MSSKLRLNFMVFLSNVEDKLMRLVGRTPVQMLERRWKACYNEVGTVAMRQYSAPVTCKNADDAHFDRYERRINELYQMQQQIDDDLCCALNTFPIDMPCTIETVANRTGIHMKTLNRLLMSEWRSEERAEDTSVTRCHRHFDGGHYAFCPPVVYNIKTIQLPNWRFVNGRRNADYLERYEVNE